MQRWKPVEFSSFYRFDLPGPDRLQVSLVKPCGGSHNRIWRIVIHQRTSDSVSVPLRLSEFDSKLELESNRQAALTQRGFLGANDTLFGDPQPGIWVRPLGASWPFLTYQGQIGSSVGPTIGRRDSANGESFDFEEGYFSWQPGQTQWQPCDREGELE